MDEPVVSRRVPSIRSLAAATASVASVATVWVSMTLIFDLIFHFHPIFLGVAAGWALRRVDGGVRGGGPAAVVAVLALLGATVGTTVIQSADGPVDPDRFTAAITILGIVAGSYILHRPAPRREAGTK